jgi:predicted HTH domain antitoxin
MAACVITSARLSLFKMTAIDVRITDELLALLKDSKLGAMPIDGQVRAALAIHLFQEGVISIGKAAELADKPRIEMEELLIEMGIPVVRLGLADYERELATLEKVRHSKP